MSPTYSSWVNMWIRCRYAYTQNYARYGGRGIGICERWKDFRLFLEDMGERPAGHTLDRIDNDGDYTPENCRWATSREQGLNRSNHRMITWNGQTKPLIVWTRELDLPYQRTYQAIVKKHIPPEKIFGEPHDV